MNAMLPILARTIARWGVLLAAMLPAGSAVAQVAPGSWVGEASSVRLFTPERVVETDELVPPGLATGATIRQVRWRFSASSAVPLPVARLCHPQRCVALATWRGHSEALAGLSADQPLTFRFSLSRSARPATPVRIEGVQVIVDYH